MELKQEGLLVANFERCRGWPWRTRSGFYSRASRGRADTGSTGARGGFQSTAGRPLAQVAAPRIRVAGATLAAQGELAVAMDKAQAADDA